MALPGPDPNGEPPHAPHHVPHDGSDRVALFITRRLRGAADLFFARRYGHRAVVLETVAAVPGMVGATLTHLRCLRRMVDDGGWIRALMDEAENERLHLMTFIEIAQPTAVERLLVLLAQGAFYIGYFGLYLVSRRTAQRGATTWCRRRPRCRRPAQLRKEGLGSMPHRPTSRDGGVT